MDQEMQVKFKYGLVDFFNSGVMSLCLPKNVNFSGFHSINNSQ